MLSLIWDGVVDLAWWQQLMARHFGVPLEEEWQWMVEGSGGWVTVSNNVVGPHEVENVARMAEEMEAEMEAEVDVEMEMEAERGAAEGAEKEV